MEEPMAVTSSAAKEFVLEGQSMKLSVTDVFLTGEN